MEQKASIVKVCKELGCCDACCLRYLGLKYPDIYDNPHKSILKYQNTQEITQKPQESIEIDQKTVQTAEISENLKTTDVEKFSEESGNGRDSPPAKRRRSDICTSCLGLLQESTWPECFEMVKEQIEKKRYDCKTFGCALSAPIATMVREKAVTLHLKEAIPSYDSKTLTPLKEAWKWSFGTKLSDQTNMTLDSGAVSPLLITVTLEYPDESQELEILKQLSPSHFESRSKQKRRFTIEFTRKSVEQALSTVTLVALKKVHGWATLPTVGVHVKCVSVVCTHTPVFLGGRYIKLSRSLPQTPWLVEGKRMMESSVQEIIFEPIAKLYGMSVEEMEHRLKFMSAGREDVDVRCLGEGRPFAIEISDPNRTLKPEELQQVCEEINKNGNIIVKQILHVTKDDLTLLKQGEETKKKTYEALCIKLSHTKDDDTSQPIKVTPNDIISINKYRNTPTSDPARIKLVQRTPIRVLHRRPLLSRCREIYELHATAVEGHPQLFTITLQTQAGTYVKEWVHGSLRRSKPALGDALGAHVDILALDVTCVHLDWPNITSIIKAPPNYKDSDDWTAESVTRLISLLQRNKETRPIVRAIRRMLPQATRRLFMSVYQSKLMFPSIDDNNYYQDSSMEEDEEDFNNVPEPASTDLDDDSIVMVRNPVEARLPSAHISVRMLREILEARAIAARMMPSTTRRTISWKEMNRTTANEGGGGDGGSDGGSGGGGGENGTTTGGGGDGSSDGGGGDGGGDETTTEGEEAPAEPDGRKNEDSPQFKAKQAKRASLRMHQRRTTHARTRQRAYEYKTTQQIHMKAGKAFQRALERDKKLARIIRNSMHKKRKRHSG